jgi:ankyrin repeat protein
MVKYVCLVALFVMSCSPLYTMDLFSAVSLGRLDRVREILNNPKVDVNKQYDSETCLMMASLLGHVEIVSTLLFHPEINVDIQAENGCTALHLAAKQCQVGTPHFWDTPSQSSIFGNSSALIAAMLLANSKKSLNVRDRNGCTPFFRAVHCGDEKVIEVLLNEPDIDVNIPANNGYSPMWIAMEHDKYCHNHHFKTTSFPSFQMTYHCTSKEKIINMIREHLKKRYQ